MNYFNVAAIMLASIHMRASRGENTIQICGNILKLNGFQWLVFLLVKQKQ